MHIFWFFWSKGFILLFLLNKGSHLYTSCIQGLHSSALLNVIKLLIKRKRRGFFSSSFSNICKLTKGKVLVVILIHIHKHIDTPSAQGLVYVKPKINFKIAWHHNSDFIIASKSQKGYFKPIWMHDYSNHLGSNIKMVFCGVQLLVDICESGLLGYFWSSS